MFDGWCLLLNYQTKPTKLLFSTIGLKRDALLQVRL